MKRQDFENALNSLDELLSTANLGEEYFQEWFETNRIIFDALGFKKVIPHGIQKSDTNKNIPDFLVQKMDDTWWILELKRPDTEILKSQKKRINFYNSFRDYISQCHEYNEFFDEKVNRDNFNSKYNVDIHKNLKSVVVAGRNDGLDRTKVHQILYNEGAKIELLTYDDIRNYLEYFRANLYSKYENFPGCSIHYLLKIFRLRNSQNFIFDLGNDLTRNRISAYIDKNDYLTYRIIDNNGDKQYLRIKEKSFGFEYGQPCYICFDFGIGSDNSLINLEINGKYFKDIVLDSMDFDFSFIIDQENKDGYLNMTLGSDISSNELSNFYQGELVMYGRTFKFQEKTEIRNYFLFNDKERNYFPMVGKTQARCVKNNIK
ncbi:MAG: DUF4263 domain-containing protein [Bacteroidales bacterium]|nr:DUF4263 domain-containing protein [Bacteroidales bacterium]